MSVDANWLGFRNNNGQAQLGVELINNDNEMREFVYVITYEGDGQIGGAAVGGVFLVGAGNAPRRWVDVVEGETIATYRLKVDGVLVLSRNDVAVPVFKA